MSKTTAKQKMQHQLVDHINNLVVGYAESNHMRLDIAEMEVCRAMESIIKEMRQQPDRWRLRTAVRKIAKKVCAV